MQKKDSINLQEAAGLLGFKGVNHLREKAKLGIIPGAFKVSNRWMFFRDDLIDFIRSFHKNLKDAAAIPKTKRTHTWQSVKRKIAPTTTPDSQSVESECKKVRKLLLAKRPRSLKKS